MAKKKIDPRLLAALVVAQGGVGALTVRDLKKRPADQVRGPKWVWYAWGGSNMLGSAVYWAVGRKRA